MCFAPHQWDVAEQVQELVVEAEPVRALVVVDEEQAQALGPVQALELERQQPAVLELATEVAAQWD
jgi:hypothetical protein